MPILPLLFGFDRHVSRFSFKILFSVIDWIDDIGNGLEVEGMKSSNW